MLPLFVFSSVCSLSYGSLSDFTITGKNIFDFLDSTTTDILLPLVSIGVCVYVGWFGPHHLLDEQLSNHGTIKSRITSAVAFVIRYVAPLLIAAIMISKLI